MIKNKMNPGRTEEFDIAAIRDLAEMAKKYVATEDRVFTAKGQNVPDGTYSDFACNVWEIMNELVRYGYYMHVREEQINKIEEKLKLMRKANTISWCIESFND